MWGIVGEYVEFTQLHQEPGLNFAGFSACWPYLEDREPAYF